MEAYTMVITTRQLLVILMPCKYIWCDFCSYVCTCVLFMYVCTYTDFSYLQSILLLTSKVSTPTNKLKLEYFRNTIINSVYDETGESQIICLWKLERTFWNIAWRNYTLHSIYMLEQNRYYTVHVGNTVNRDYLEHVGNTVDRDYCEHVGTQLTGSTWNML